MTSRQNSGDTSSRPLAVVTGASSGIGLELARQFAENGFDLVVAADDAELQRAAASLGGTGADVRAVQVDLADPRASRRCMAPSRRRGVQWRPRR